MSSHFIQKCGHGTVIAQCKCIGEKQVQIVPCQPHCPQYCYCVCHSELSSRASCKHCLGVNEVGLYHMDYPAMLEKRDLIEAELEKALGVVLS